MRNVHNDETVHRSAGGSPSGPGQGGPAAAGSWDLIHGWWLAPVAVTGGGLWTLIIDAMRMLVY